MVDITDVSGNLTDFLQQKAAAGKLIIVTGSKTTTGVICSYTPASGQTFVLVKASITPKSSGSATTTSALSVEVRNNGTVQDYLGGNVGVVTGASPLNTPPRYDSIITGDQLVGTGSLVYDLDCVAIDSGGTITVYGTILGYLL